MEQSNKIFQILSLKYYLKENYGNHYPFEIIELIIMIDYDFIKQISCGWYHDAILTKSGKIFFWGRNNFGQLGLGNNENQNTPQELNLPNIASIHCGENHTIALTKYGKIFIWGYNFYGQLGLGNNQNKNTPQELNLPNWK